VRTITIEHGVPIDATTDGAAVAYNLGRTVVADGRYVHLDDVAALLRKLGDNSAYSIGEGALREAAIVIAKEAAPPFLGDVHDDSGEGS
jgi:hypothetical protein